MEPIQPVEPVSLDTVNPIYQPVSIDTRAEGNPTPSAPIADVRSKKASFGVGELLGKSQQEIYVMMMQGREQDLRNEAAAKLDAINDQKRIDRAVELVRSKGQTLTVDEMEALRKKPFDPSSVFEQKYVEKFLNNTFPTAAAMNGIDMDTAMEAAPERVMQDLETAKTYMGNFEYARRRQEDMQQVYENQGWLPWIADEAKTLVPFYSYAKLRGWMQGQPGFSDLLPGSNLESQTRNLLKLPGEEFRPKLDQILERLSKDNPMLALQYANAVMGMSTSDVGLTNLTTAIDVTSIPGTGAALKGLKSVLSVRTALKDAVKANAGIATPTPATVAEAFGDTGTAATLRATDKVMNDIAGTTEAAANTANINNTIDPIARAKQALPTGLNLDKENIAANGRPLSQELLNRILQDQDVASKAIIDVIENTAKVQRIPLEEAGARVMARVKEEVANQNPGIKNAIADIGDPVWNPFGPNYNFPIRLFNWTGEQFATEAAARRFAKEHGILEYEIGGTPGARYYIPEAAVKRSWESKPRIREVLNEDGNLRVLLDDGSEVEVSLTPQLGMIPISVDAKGAVKFHPTLGTGEDVGKAVIEQRGLGYHLNIWKPLNEGESFLKDLVVDLPQMKSIVSKGGVDAVVNSIKGVGVSRSSDITLSPFETLQRKTAVYSVSNYQKLMQNEMKYIEDVARGRVRIDPVTGEDIFGPVSYLKMLSPIATWKSHDSWDELTRALAAAPGMKDPKTGATGYLLSNPSEIQDFWRANFNKSASFEQIRAYLAYKRNYENDRVFRSVREYTNKVRLGAEQHSVSYIDKNGNKIESPFFDGVQLKGMPSGDYPVLIIDGASTRIRLASAMGPDYKRLNEAVKKGEMVATEIYAPELRPLKNMPEVGYNYVRYVVSPAGSRQTKGLSWDQVNRLSGGHFSYDYSHSVKEARVIETRAGNKTYHSYEGDNHFMFVTGNAQGQEIAKVLNAVKAELRAGDEAAAREIFENGLKGAQGPAMEWKDFIKRTKPMKDEHGNTIPPQINIKEPYYVVPKGRSIYEMDNSLEKRYGTYDAQGKFQSTFQDRTKSGSLSRQYQVGYTQERDAENPMALRNVGSKENPIYKYEPAKLVDPLVTMNRALNEITRSSIMDDMKIAGIETWLREAEPWLKADDIEEIRGAPFKFFKNAETANAFRPGTPKDVVANLLSNRFKTQQFIGIPSKYDLFMQDASQKLSDWMYDKMGPKSELVPVWALTKTTSPVQYLRSMAYHAKLGLFATPQILTQSQTYLTIASLAPRSAPSGTYGALLSQWAKLAVSEAHLDMLDNWATKLSMVGEKGTLGLFHGWKPGEWKEAYKEMQNRGFSNVGSEYSALETLPNKFRKGIEDDVLDAGQMFFKMTEQNVRFGAWMTAYKEYKAANNIRNMTRSDWDKVLNRADDMSGNMSRASASILQSGPASLPFQFLTYQIHLAENFWGKMTPLEKVRMGAIYGSMFGVGALGITGLPTTHFIRQTAIENGYVVGDNWLSSMVMEGIPAVFLAWATSPDGDLKKGNFYNINDRLGVGGLTTITEALRSDTPWYAFLAGASGSIAANTWKGSEGLRTATWDTINGAFMTGNENDKPYKSSMDDWINTLKEIAIVDAARKGDAAVAFGKWLSKNDTYQADVSKANAIFMSLTGLNLQNAADNYVVSTSIKDRQEKEKKALNLYTRDIRRAIQAAQDNDWETYKLKMGNAYRWLEVYDYPIEDYPKAAAIASKGWESRINSIRQEFYTKNAPAGKEEQYGDAWQRFLQTQEK